MTPLPLQNLINHFAFVLDASGSMQGLSQKLVSRFDQEITSLKARSQELNQETRISVYLFDDKVTPLVYDMDVMRMPSISKHYKLGGRTRLLDATGQAIKDLQKTPELYGDHAFLVQVLTDGQENASRDFSRHELKALVDKLGENWTLVAQVPDNAGFNDAVALGFPRGNILIWDTTAAGYEAAHTVTSSAISSYMTARATGVRGSRSFYAPVDTSKLTEKVVAAQVPEYKGPVSVSTNGSAKALRIDELVSATTFRPYVVGNSYYHLVKKETIQPGKKILLQDKRSGRLYLDGNTRALLGLPSQHVQVAPSDHPTYDIYVQSTSVNRNIIPNQKVITL